MLIKLFLETIFKFLLGFLLIGLLIFLPAGTVEFYNGWLLLHLLFIPMLIVAIIMFVKNPMLLEKRLKLKEKEKEQKIVVALSGIMFVIGFILAGLNYRFDWIQVPKVVVIISSLLFLMSYLMYVEVLRENTFLVRTVEVVENQKLVDNGLYVIVRHPMYTATIFLFLSMPLVLGSIISFIVFLFYPFLIVKRITNEEKVLEKELEGYIEYKKKVKYRIIPFVW